MSAAIHIVSPLVLICNVQGGIYKLTSTNWTTLPLPITSAPFSAVGSGWTNSVNFAFRCHDDVVDASMSSIAQGGQLVSYVAFCK